MSLVVTGTVSIDTVATPTSRAEGVLGGSCTFFAAAASFFTPVRMVAVVGDDFPEHHARVLERFPAIDRRGLERRAGARTFRWGGRYRENMDQRDTLFTELNVIAERPPEVPPAFRDSRLVFLANTHPGVQAAMLSAFESPSLVVADTMDLWISTTPKELRDLLARVDGLVLNYDEAEQLTGLRNTVAAARRVLEMGPRFVVVKKGEHGCILVCRDKGAADVSIAALPAYPSERVVDPTGAGDSFAGGMMGVLAESVPAADAPRNGGRGPWPAFDTLRRACVAGTVVASFTIEAFSLDRLTTLRRGEIDARLEEYARMLRV